MVILATMSFLPLLSGVLPALVIRPAAANYPDPWYSTSWAYRQQLNISASTSMPNQPFNFTLFSGVGTSSGTSIYLQGHAQSSFGDIVITDSNNNTVPYFLSLVNSGANATMYVKFPAVNSTVLRYYIYYGDSGATSQSSGASTFPFFTPFNGTSIPSGWIASSGSPTYNSTGAYFNGAMTIDSNWTLGNYWNFTNYEAAVHIVYDTANTPTDTEGYRLAVNGSWASGAEAGGGCLSRAYFTNSKYASSSDQMSTLPFATVAITILGYEAPDNTYSVFTFAIDNGASQTVSNNAPAATHDTKNIEIMSSTNNAMHVTWAFVMPLATSTPAYAYGSEETSLISYTLTVNPPTGGAINATTSSYLNATVVGLLATASSHFAFANWQVDGVNSTTNPTSVTMTANHTVSAYFTQSPPNATWFSSSWPYRIQHNITVSSSITAMQSSITVINGTGTDSGSILYLNNLTKPDFSDVRIVDAYGTLLPVWNSTNNAGANCTIFFKDDFVAGVNNTFYIYYGNPSAPVAWDGASVWQYFQNYTYSGMAFPVNYTKFSGNPVLTSSTNSIRDAGLIYYNDVWYLIYSNWTSLYGASGGLWIANSSNLATWNVMGEAVVPTGWEGARLDAPMITQVGSTFYVFFTGYVYEGTVDPTDNMGQIGYASTTDITNITSWVQGDTSAPLVAAAAGTYKAGIMDPSLVINGSTAYLFYTGYWANGVTTARNECLCVATTPLANFPNGPWTDSPLNPLVIVPWKYISYDEVWGSEGWNMVYDSVTNEYIATFTAQSPADAQSQVFSAWSKDLYHWYLVPGADLTRTQSWEYSSDEIGGSAWTLINGTLYGVYSGTNSVGLHALGLFNATMAYNQTLTSIPFGNTVYTIEEAMWNASAGSLQYTQQSPSGSTGDDLNMSPDQAVTWPVQQFSYPVKIVTTTQLFSYSASDAGMGIWLGSNGQNYVLGEMKAGTAGASVTDMDVLMNITNAAWTSWLGNVTWTPDANYHLEELDYNGSNIAYYVDGNPIANVNVPYSTVEGGLRDRVWGGTDSATMNDQYVYIGKLATLTDGSYGAQETQGGGVVTVTVTIDSSPSALGYCLVVDGSTIIGPATYSWTANSLHTVSALSPVNDWTFSSWSDGGLQYHTINASSSYSLTASYALQTPTSQGPPYQLPTTTVLPTVGSTEPILVTVTVGRSTTTNLPILPPGNETGWIVANVTTGNTPPYIGIEFNGTLPTKPIPSSGTSVGVTVSAGGGAIPGTYQIPVTTTFQDAYNRTVTTKSWLNIDVEALGAVPWANWFAWFLIGIFALMLLGATQTKKKP